MTDLKNNIIKNILNKKFTRANNDMAKLLKDKAYSAIDNFKDSFKLNIPTEPTTEPVAEPVAEPELEPVLVNQPVQVDQKGE